MPVSRNLSLPSSIERKFKKRPEELHDLKHCFSMPCDMQNNNTGNTDDDISQNKDLTSSPMKKNVLAVLKSKNFPLNQPVQRQVSRTSLSHPCLSDRTNISVTCILPHLFLGSQKDVADKEMLTENDITNVLNVSCNCARPEHLDDRHFHRIAIRDNYQEEITPHLDEAVNFIEAARQRNERVLVHCLAGVSRSATVAIAYVMYYLNLSFDDAYRFVKDKRPTISPNFNFVGQLLEYEKNLQERGCMKKAAAYSLLDQKSSGVPLPGFCVHLKDTPKALMAPTIEITKPLSQPIKFETAVLIKPCIVTPSTTTSSSSSSSSSSFCRRRKAPALERLSFSRDGSPTSALRESNDFQRRNHPNVATPGGAGVVLDLHVSVPPTEPYCRRLGSDGVEDDGEDDEADHRFNSMVFSHKSNSFPRCRSGLLGEINGCRTPPADELSLSFRSSTAPTTPSTMCLGSNVNSLTSPGSAILGSCKRPFSHDVEMTPVDDDTFPPSPQRSCRETDNTGLLLAAPRIVNDACGSSLGSPLLEKFVSRKTRSPKVLKKSFNLNLRPSYGYQAFRSTKQVNLQAPIPYQNRCQVVAKTHCESPSTDGISSLTLYSPGVLKNDPLEITEKNCLQIRDKNSLRGGPVASSSSVTVPTHGVSYAARDMYSTGGTSTSKLGSKEPFKLVASTDLKPKWRHRSKESKSSSSGSSPPSSPTVMNHCNNLEILSCF